MHTEFDLAQSLHRERLRNAEDLRRSQRLRKEQKRRDTEARAAHRTDSRAPASALRAQSA